MEAEKNKPSSADSNAIPSKSSKVIVAMKYENQPNRTECVYEITVFIR